MTHLRVVVDQLLSPVPGGIGRYAAELTRALATTALSTDSVTPFVSATSDQTRVRLADELGVSAVDASVVPRRGLALAWQYGLATIPGTVHGTSLLSPLVRRHRGAVVTTIHDAVPWTHPETLTPRGVRWHRAMGTRAARFADAVVVPSRAVGDALGEHLPLGDRVRVVPGAVAEALAVPIDAEIRRSRLGLPDRYVLAVGTLEPRKGLDLLIRAMADVPGLALVHAGPPGWGGVDIRRLANSAGLAPERLRVLGRVDDVDLAAVMTGATVFAFPSISEGFGLPVLEAFALGAPVVHADVPAVLEVSGGAGVTVPHGPGFVDGLRSAIVDLSEDDAHADSIRSAQFERSRAFSWRRSAQQVWDLHRSLGSS